MSCAKDPTFSNDVFQKGEKGKASILMFLLLPNELPEELQIFYKKFVQKGEKS
jgi:hypothetical protein